MKKQALPLLLALTFLAPASHAEDLMKSIRDKWADVKSGRTTSEQAVPASGVADSWGSPAPVAAPKPVRAEQQRDVRLSDERYTDESRHKEVATPSKNAKAAPVLAARVRVREREVDSETAAPAPRRAARAPEAPAYEPELSASRPVLRATSACTNVSRAWEGAAALASRGQTDRAYDAYLRLLSSCTDDRELLGTAYQAQRNLDPEQLDQLLNEPVLASPRMGKVVMVFTLQHMYAENKAKHFDRALQLSRSIRQAVLHSRDAGALEVSGWLEQQAEEYAQSENLFRAAMEVDKRSEGAQEGLALALLAQSKTDEAAKLVSRMTTTNVDSLRAEVLVAQARDLLKRKDPKAALRLLDKAESMGRQPDDATIATMGWALRATGDAEKAKTVFSALHEKDKRNEEYQRGLLETAAETHDFDTVTILSQEGGRNAARAKEILAEHYTDQGRYALASEMTGVRREDQGSEVGGAVGVRNKSGTKGEGRLSVTTTPEVSAKLALGDRASLEAKGSSMTLDDGVRKVEGHRASLTAKVALDEGDITAKVGAVGTPGQNRAEGELRYRQYTDSGYVEGGVSREAVTDSVRSFAGAVDKKGNVVGPASKTEIAVSGKTEVAKDVNVQWNAGGGAITAKGADSNNFVEAGAAITKDFKAKGFSWLNAGGEVRISRFKSDQNQFEGANGGYYSPTAATDVGLVANALTTEGRKFLAKGSVRTGYTSRTLSYGSETGIYFEGDAAAAALLYPHMIVGAGLGSRSAPGYTESAFRFWLTVPFEARKGLYTSDLKPGQ